MESATKRVRLPVCETVCQECPWRITNQGRKHPQGHYTKASLKRLWDDLRKGVGPLLCLFRGCEGRECRGSIVLVKRELARMLNPRGGITEGSILEYLAARPGALTRDGAHYWLARHLRYGERNGQRHAALPKVQDDPEVGLPEFLEVGG